MKISFIEDEKDIAFVISEYPDEYKSILESQYYLNNNGNFFRHKRHSMLFSFYRDIDYLGEGRKKQ